MRRVFPALVACLVLFAAPARAVEPGEMLSDPKLETRAREISSELRCLVCQNQSIDDSAAPLAKDLRLLVRERLTAGDSDAQVKTYLVDRYGDFILLKPPFRLGTLLLWGTPLVALIGGGLAMALAARRRQQLASTGPAALSEDERARLEKLLG